MSLKQTDRRHLLRICWEYLEGHMPSLLFGFPCFPSHLLPCTVIQCFNIFKLVPTCRFSVSLVTDFLKLNAVESKRGPQRGAMRDEEDRYYGGDMGPPDPTARRYPEMAAASSCTVLKPILFVLAILVCFCGCVLEGVLRHDNYL